LYVMLQSYKNVKKNIVTTTKQHLVPPANKNQREQRHRRQTKTEGKAHAIRRT